MQHPEHEPQVPGGRRLAGEQRGDCLLDALVLPVDLVVEGDHLVGELWIALLERLHRASKRPQDELAFLDEVRLDRVELDLKRDPHPAHPKRPVT